MHDSVRKWFPDFPVTWASYCDSPELEGVCRVLTERLAAESGSQILPARRSWFRALELTSPTDVRAVILGQDPYINVEGGVEQAMGLSFSVPDGLKEPPSLRNIYKEMLDDIGNCPLGTDLTEWARQGVLLLNTILTVRAGSSNSHADFGWHRITESLIANLAAHHANIVFILWGDKAARFASRIDPSRHLILRSPHPSPLSSYRGFFGSRPFSQANQFLLANGRGSVDWAMTNIPSCKVAL